MELNTGKFGATRQSWARASIRTIYAEIVAKHPRAGHSTLVRLVAERLREDDDALQAAADYVVTNCEEAQEGYAKRQQRQPASPQERAQRQDEIKATVESIKSQILLLNLEMPNGKRMRYCTREEMALFGAGYVRLAKRMKPGQMVGQAFNEKQVRELVKC